MNARSPSSGLRAAVGFLTPLGGASTPAPTALRWFPVVGAAVGAAVGAIWWAAGQLWPAPVAAALAVVADLALTGMLHFDGLCDSADGLLAHLSRERRLEVMASPEIGAFGLAAGAAALLTRWTVLATTHPSPLLLAALWATARTCMALTVAVVPYARPGGLAQVFRPPDGRAGARGVPVAVAGLVGALALGALWRPLAGPAAVTAAVAAAAAVVLFAQRRLGGFTGDVLGAAGVVGETVGLLVAAAHW